MMGSDDWRESAQPTAGADAVSAYFTEQSAYWSALYEPTDQGPSTYTRCARAFMGRRRTIVLSAIDFHFAGRSADILDAGCGAGVYAHDLAARGHRVVAVDASEGMLELARQRVRACPNVTLLNRDIHDLDFEDRSFDAVLSVGVLEYVADLPKAVSELLRVTRPGGLLIVSFPNLLRLGHVMDPYYYLVRAPRYLYAALRKGRGSSGTAVRAVDLIGRNIGFNCRRFTRSRVARMFQAQGCVPVARHDVCFGSPTFCARDIFPVEATLAMSRRLCALSGMRGLRWLGAFADRWVFIYRKESQ